MNFDRTPTAIATAAQLSRIEEIGAQLALLRRQHGELDDLSVELTGEDLDSKIARSNAEQTMATITGDITALTHALALQKPKTARELFICLLHVLSPAQTTADAVPDDAPEKNCGEIAYRILRAMLPGMEALAGVTRTELGCIGRYYEDLDTEGLIGEMRKLAAPKEAASC